jgi:hypothetical protein
MKWGVNYRHSEQIGLLLSCLTSVTQMGLRHEAPTEQAVYLEPFVAAPVGSSLFFQFEVPIPVSA